MADEQQHGRAVLFRSVDADSGICGAGAARDEQGGGPAGQFAECLRRKGATTLMARGDKANLIAVAAQGFEDGQKTFPRYSKGRVDAVGN